MEIDENIYSDMKHQEKDTDESQCCWTIGCIYIKWLFREPQFVFKVFVTILCMSVVLYQLAQGTIKSQSNSEASYTFMKLNKTFYYPSLSICQHPPLGPGAIEDMKSSAKNIDIFESISLNENLEATYTYPTMTTTYGYCQTIVPNITVNRIGKLYGYDVKLKHTNNTPPYQTIDGHKLFGWHIFIQETTQKFEEHFAIDSHADYIFLRINSQMDVKLKAQKFVNYESCMPAEAVLYCYNNCFKPHNLGSGICTNTNGNECDNFMLTQINNGTINCNCPQVCTAIIYDTFVEETEPYNTDEVRNVGRLLLYYTSKNFMQVHQRRIYDLFQLFGDISGIIAFLLGVSITKLSDTIYKFITLTCCTKNNADGVSSAIMSRKTSHD